MVKRSQCDYGANQLINTLPKVSWDGIPPGRPPARQPPDSDTGSAQCKPQTGRICRRRHRQALANPV